MVNKPEPIIHLVDGQAFLEQTKFYKAKHKPLADRIGVYRTKHRDLGKGYSWWFGKYWSNQYETIASCIANSGIRSGFQDKRWHGVVKYTQPVDWFHKEESNE